VPADHPLRVRGVDLAALTEAQWIDAPALTSGPRSINGCAPSTIATTRFEGADVASLLHLVAAGHGIALLPSRVVDLVGGIRAVPVAKPALVHRTEVLSLKNAVPRLEPLIDALRS